MLAPVEPRLQPLSELLAGLIDAWVADIEIAGVAIDSRKIHAHSLFLACPGTRSHGLDHALAAIDRGAVAVAWDEHAEPKLAVPTVFVPALGARAGEIAARLYSRPSERLFVTGITGTDGKSSCAWLLADALTRLGRRCGYLGTLGLGLTGDLAPATHTTPDPVRVQDWLARLVAAKADAAALEVSSHALAQHRVDAVAFDVAVLTQLGRDHLDYHGNVAAYRAAKRRLFDSPGLRFAVLNADDETGRAWLADLPAGVRPIAYGRSANAAVAAHFVQLREVEARVDGLVVELDTHAGAARLESPLVGVFNAHNLAAVLAVLLAHDVALDGAVDVLSQLSTVPGRMERVAGRAGQPLVIVDYAHTPGALEHALAALRPHAEGALYCVFGCGGDRDRGKRALMGRAAARGADRLWITDDNPRSEVPAAIVADILKGIDNDAVFEVMHDRGQAIATAIGAAGAADLVLIAGKGHEDTQQTGADRRAFDDRIAARRALEAA